jgi:glycosyltransferase involved in cell wall biosynthesis
MSSPKVTFGIVNCNRLFYLKSCVESLLYCTSDYENKEVIIVDNASIEKGTEEYLSEKEQQGLSVVRMANRDPSSEFARGLNTIMKKATGKIIIPLQGDMQFILKGGWLNHYVNLLDKHEGSIGCMLLDAQRNIRNKSATFSQLLGDPEYPFIIDVNRFPFSGAADSAYNRKVADFFGAWNEDNLNHEGGSDSETYMRNRVTLFMEQNKDVKLFAVQPIFSPAASIFTDSRGTNARVRGNRLYGDYWEAKEDFKYYKIHEFDDALKMCKDKRIPIGIEDIAHPIGFEAPIDSTGNWKKNPIRPETAIESDYVELEYGGLVDNEEVISDPDYMRGWLDDE